MKCCICKKEIEKVGDWNLGNNAEPVASGRCCNKCNAEKVIPERIIQITNFNKNIKKVQK